MAFKLAKVPVLGNSHATHGSYSGCHTLSTEESRGCGTQTTWEWLINCVVADHSQLCYIYNMHHEGSSPGPGRAHLS